MISYLLQDEHPPEDLTEYVTGRERWKYHKRPLKPMIAENEERFGLNSEANLNGQEKAVDEFPLLASGEVEREAEKHRSIGVQTVYREAETQTDPFSPPEHIPKDTSPEVLILKDHVWGRGLPATMEEMYFIEEKREKTMFDGALPPTSDEACFHLRRKLMEDQEIREWRKRENEIKKVQNERLNLLQSALIMREKDNEEYGQKRIESIRANKTDYKNRLIAKIQRRKIKILRKILKNRNAYEEKDLKRDIVQEYHNFASRVYANITREGLSLEKLSNKFEVQPFSLQSYEAFEDLVSLINPKYLNNTFNLKDFTDKIQLKYKKLEQIHRAKLQVAQENILRNKQRIAEGDQKNAEEEKKHEYIARPDTPVIEYGKPDKSRDADEVTRAGDDSSKHANEKAMNKQQYAEWNKKEEAIILLQRLIQGRAEQNIMFEGKEKRLALIEELLIVSNIKELDKGKEQELLMEQHQQRVKNAFVEALQGEAIAETVEGLSKELLRFKEERKIEKFVKKAEDERRKREAEETGRRQAELTLRKRENVLYAEIMKVHQGTVDSYLRRIISKSIDHLATKEAMKLTHLYDEKVENKLQGTKRQEGIIKDMVSSLLVPNIERMKVARQINLEQQRYNVAVRDTLKQVFE